MRDLNHGKKRIFYDHHKKVLVNQPRLLSSIKTFRRGGLEILIAKVLQHARACLMPAHSGWCLRRVRRDSSKI